MTDGQYKAIALGSSIAGNQSWNLSIRPFSRVNSPLSALPQAGYCHKECRLRHFVWPPHSFALDHRYTSQIEARFYLVGFSTAGLFSFIGAQAILALWIFAAGIVLYRRTEY
jgi:hypothetical protein